jgi:hypothetical protein
LRGIGRDPTESGADEEQRKLERARAARRELERQGATS